jgi:ubiquinol-cytochrome c reductase cytochrome b subunit
MLSFNSHAAYYPTNVVVNFNFIFGSIIFSSLLLQIISGIALAIFYSPHHSIAFLTVIFIMSDVNFG